jgi:hypothetical protein
MVEILGGPADARAVDGTDAAPAGEVVLETSRNRTRNSDLADHQKQVGPV